MSEFDNLITDLDEEHDFKEEVAKLFGVGYLEVKTIPNFKKMKSF